MLPAVVGHGRGSAIAYYALLGKDFDAINLRSNELLAPIMIGGQGLSPALTEGALTDPRRRWHLPALMFGPRQPLEHLSHDCRIMTGGDQFWLG
jgi:hypothetical protein